MIILRIQRGKVALTSQLGAEAEASGLIDKGLFFCLLFIYLFIYSESDSVLLVS